MRTFAKGKKFMHVPAEGGAIPTFSEGFLYPRIGKDDARFVLGVAEEYEKIIEILGEGKVREILEGGKSENTL